MSGNIDALGGLVDAGLVGKAIDRPTGEGGINAAEVAGAHHECANCGQHLTGNYCANCGQQAHVHRSLAHVGEEFVHGITHFDGKTWKTLPMLLFRPGRLTREYIEGKRARYIAPVPLFLLVVFLMFFVFSFVHVKPGGGATDSNGKQLTQAEAIVELPKINTELANLDRDLAAAKAKGAGTGEIAVLNGVRTGVVATRDRLKARAEGEIASPMDFPGEMTRQIEESYKSGDINVNLGNETINERARAALRNPQLALYKVQNKIYKFSFLLVPLSLPWLWLMFAFRRNVRMYDHAVFALYSISFMSLLFIVGSIALALDFVAGVFWGFLIFVAPALHWYVQLKGTYSLSRWGAAWRTVAISVAAVMTLSIYLSITLAIGLID
ncbi:DUF3667 domain-containing protein [Sandarakinorhabdus sp. DWP1-3-1]|uniref:DUF3667 domain-containing protein n=1 Tax=Sandarakinorhabdus sp. DWP1-3-1 TaxID=2804627 RepID=UPI003CEE3633